MPQTIKGRLELSFTLLVAGSLAVMLALTVWLTYSLVGELRPQILGAVQETQTLNEKNLLLNSAAYLSARLYPRLAQGDPEGLKHEIQQIKDWLPIQSFVVTDPMRRVITDGTATNRIANQIVDIPTERLVDQPEVSPQEGGNRLYFRVGSGDDLAGYAVVTLSNAALQTSLRVLDDRVATYWQNTGRALLLGAAITLLAIAASAAVLIWRVSRSVSYPISEMIHAAEAYANGNLDIALPVRDETELGHLARALNTMAKELKVSHRRMRHLANYDTLTGLPNRHLFQDRLRHALQAAERSGECVGLLFLDLDGFKEVNDSLGHGLGDEVLKLVATRLRDCVRASDTVARLGGDEFTIIAERAHAPDDLETLADKLLASLRQPYQVQDHQLSLSASIGITLYPQDGFAPDVLLRNADTAMYVAKKEGKNAYSLFKPEHDAQSNSPAGLELALRRAIHKREFELHYQPQVDSRTGDLVGVEALLRWRNPRELIQPAEFIPLLEDTGLITQLTVWILEDACEQLAAWRTAQLPELRLGINLSTHQLEQSDLVSTIGDILAEHDLPPEALEIEITESSMLDAEQSQAVADQLAKLGIRLAIDDFGTGYSSLVNLQRFSVDTLKIDRSFIRELTSDRESAAVTAAMIALARQLGIKTLAEGVETSEQWQALKAEGCDLIQGYVVAHPVTADQFLTWATEREKTDGSAAMA